MAIRERLIYAIEIVTDKAQAGIKGFRQSVSEADGAVGKFSAGASSAMATVAANAGTLAIAGGGALLAFGAKAVKSSQDTALAAGKLADATGLTVESASRLREVSADLGVSGETVTAIVKKMVVEIGKGGPVVDDLGVALQHTDDGAADVNATLLDTIERIGAIEDPTKRAAAAQAIFGRGYAEAAELIFTNADKLKQKLDEVSDAKVVTPEELARAREFRDNLEELKDVGEDLSVSTGQVVIPVLGDLARILKGIADAAEEAKGRIEDIPGGGGFLDTVFSGIPDIADEALFRLRELEEGLGFEPRVEIGPLREQFNQMVAAANAGTDAVDEFGVAADETADELADLGDKAANSGPKIGDMAGALDDAEQHLADLNAEARDNALDELADAVAAVGDALDESFGSLEDDLGSLDLFDDIQEQFDKIAEAAKNATDPQGVRDLNREVRRLQGQLLDYLRTVDDIPPDKVTEIIAQIRTGDIDTLRETLDELTQDRFINIGIATKGIPLFSGANVNFNPSTGSIAPVINPVAPSQSAIPGGSVDQRTIINNYPVGSTPTTQYQNTQLDVARNGIR